MKCLFEEGKKQKLFPPKKFLNKYFGQKENKIFLEILQKENFNSIIKENFVVYSGVNEPGVKKVRYYIFVSKKTKEIYLGATGSDLAMRINKHFGLSTVVLGVLSADDVEM